MVKIKEIMRRYVVTIDPDMLVSDAAKMMSSNQIGSVIVSDGTKPVDIITADDIVGLVAIGKNSKTTKVKDISGKKKLITISPEDDIVRVSRLMIKSGVKRFPVLHDGKLVGIVSEKEIVSTTPEMLEVLSERLRARASSATPFEDKVISGLCERCEAYSDNLRSIGGRWLCEDCRNLEGV